MDTDQHVLQKQFDSIFHFTNYGIWILDNQGGVLKVNDAAERLIGITAKEVVGKKIMELEQLKHITQRYQDELSNINLADLQAHGIVSESMEMRQMLNAALKLSRLDASNILITGESGTGKGLVAQFIHNKSKRKNKPFVQVNCAALPESLLEAELFGYDKGAFTGATKGKVGYFEMAQDGTILLDEIGELPFSVQAKLLKCLEDHQV